MAFSVRGTSIGSSTQITLPTGIQNNDIIVICQVTYATSNVAPAAPSTFSGTWTTVRSAAVVNSSSYNQFGLWYRTANGTESGSSVSLSSGSSTAGASQCYVISGATVDTTGYGDVTSSAPSGTFTPTNKLAPSSTSSDFFLVFGTAIFILGSTSTTATMAFPTGYSTALGPTRSSAHAAFISSNYTTGSYAAGTYPSFGLSWSSYPTSSSMQGGIIGFVNGIQSASGSDSAGAADAVTSFVTAPRTTSNSAAATDAVTRNSAVVRTASEATSTTEAATRSLVMGRSAAEYLSGWSGLTRGSGLVSSLVTPVFSRRDQPVVTADSVVQHYIAVRLAGDSVGGTDAATRSVVLARALAETVHATEALTSPTAHARTTSDAVLAIASSVRAAAYIRVEADNAAAADVLTSARGPVRSAADSAPAVDTLSTLFVSVRVASDAAPAADSSITSPAHHFRTGADSASAVDVVVSPTLHLRTTADGVGATDVSTRHQVLTRALTDSAPSADSAPEFATHYRTSDDSIPIADAATRTGVFVRAVGESVGGADGVVSWVLHHRTATDSSVAVEVATRGISYVRSALDTVTATEVLASPVLHLRVGGDAAAAVETAGRSQVLTRAVADTSHATDAVQAPSSHTRTASDAASALDNAVQNATRARTGSDGVGGSDGASRVILLLRSAADVAYGLYPTAPAMVGPLIRPVLSFIQRTGLTDFVDTFQRRGSDGFDSAGATDGATRQVAYARSATETLSISDSADSPGNTHRFLADSAPAADAATRSQVLGRSTTDSAFATYTYGSPMLRRPVHPVFSGDVPLASFGISDYATRLIGRGVLATDSVQGADSLVTYRSMGRVITDSAPSADLGAVRSLALGRSMLERAFSPTGTNQGIIRLPVHEVLSLGAVSGLSDSASGQANRIRSAVDLLLTRDSALRGHGSFFRDAHDFALAQDQGYKGLPYFATGLDVAQAVDAVVRHVVLTRVVGDGAAAVDVGVTHRGYTRFATDAVSLADAVAAHVVIGRIITDSVQGMDAVARHQALTRVVREFLHLAESATRQQALHFGLGETVHGTDLLTQRALHLRSGVDLAQAGDLLVVQRGVYGTTVDVALAQDTGRRALLIPRHSSDALRALDAVSGFGRRTRDGADSVAASDAAVRHLLLPRRVVDTAAVTDAAGRAVAKHRATPDALRLVEGASRSLVLTRVLPEGVGGTDLAVPVYGAHRLVVDLAPAADAVVVIEVPFVPFGPPVATVLSVDRAKVSAVGGFDVALVQFRFDQPVIAWTVRVNSTGPYDGRVAAWWEGPDPVTDAVAEVTWDDLLHGMNVVSVYGRADDGEWGLL